MGREGWEKSGKVFGEAIPWQSGFSLFGPKTLRLASSSGGELSSAVPSWDPPTALFSTSFDAASFQGVHLHALTSALSPSPASCFQGSLVTRMLTLSLLCVPRVGDGKHILAPCLQLLQLQPNALAPHLYLMLDSSLQLGATPLSP